MRRAVSVMSFMVSAFTFEASPERARDTVDLDMPSSLAISFIVMYFDISRMFLVTYLFTLYFFTLLLFYFLYIPIQN